MAARQYSPQEIAERGEAIYEQDIRDGLATDTIGMHLVLDIETGEYEIDPDDLEATKRMMEKHPHAVLYGLRIGYPAAYRLGGFSKVRLDA